MWLLEFFFLLPSQWSVTLIWWNINWNALQDCFVLIVVSDITVVKRYHFAWFTHTRGRKYLTMLWTHFIYGYMASDGWSQEGERERGWEGEREREYKHTKHSQKPTPDFVLKWMRYKLLSFSVNYFRFRCLFVLFVRSSFPFKLP